MRLIDADNITTETFKVYVGENGGFISFGDAVDAIEAIPTISNWIPVSERLPSEYGNYLVSTNDDRVLECDIGTYCDWLGRWDGCDANGVVRDIEVIAWMPLPEPYKKGE